MKLLEYEAKSILADGGIVTPRQISVISVKNVMSVDSPQFPVVVKSQVPVGGRGKAGGIKLARDQVDLEQAIGKISHKSIKGFTPSTILIEQAVDIDREFYLSLVVNRTDATIHVIAHEEGGVEVESQEGFFTRSLDGKNFDQVGESLAELYSIEDKSFRLADIVESLYKLFIKNDATLIEINPLILTKQGELIAGDCKMTLDDDAAFRHPEWQFEEQPESNNFVVLDPEGRIATIANGAGLSMATVDAVADAGLHAANFLDIGGSATVEGIVESFEKIMEFPYIDAIIINIFGGIVRCDDVAKAIVAARAEFPNLPRLAIRLSGTNSEQAAKILENEGLSLAPDLATCLEEVAHG